jgi:formamidopyrimidine-DNA glycosylase
VGRPAGASENPNPRRSAIFELPEIRTLARQISQTLAGKGIRAGHLGNRPHKFVWHNTSPAEFEGLTKGRTLGEATARGKWLFIPLEPGYLLLVGESGGRMLYHPPGTQPPVKYHLLLEFEDDSSLSATTKMWGAYDLYRRGEERDRQYIRDMRVTPDSPDFDLDYFYGLIDEVLKMGKRSVKGLLTQDQLIPGLGNAIAQDILFLSKLHPRRDLEGLTPGERRALFEAILAMVAEVTAKGGRHDEFDLFGQPGGYLRIMDAGALKRPCPRCGGKIVKIQYLGGSCYACPTCQMA